MSASGLSKVRLRRLREVLTRHVESGNMPGLVALVARRGEVHVEAIGTTEAGGTGTSVYTDPAEDLIGILLTQREMTSPLPPLAFRDFWTCAYQAIDD